MIDLTTFQQLSLLAIAIEERHENQTPHGLKIKEYLTDWYRARGELGPNEDVNHGRLYPNLDELVDAGLVRKTERDKRTNNYTLTEEGSEQIENLERLIRRARGQDVDDPFAGAALSGDLAQADD